MIPCQAHAIATRYLELVGAGAYLLSDQAIAWCGPGAMRLHYTLATGAVASKTDACSYGPATFPERWRPILREAVAIRQGKRTLYRNRFIRRRDARDFLRYLTADVGTGIRPNTV